MWVLEIEPKSSEISQTVPLSAEPYLQPKKDFK